MTHPDTEPQPNEADMQPMQGLLLTGEGLAAMTPERLQMLEQMLGGLGLQVTAIKPSEAPQPRSERLQDPVLGSFDDFVAFADRSGYSRRRAHTAWRAVLHSATSQRTRDQHEDLYPQVRYIQPEDQATLHQGWIDLRSVHARLIASSMQNQAWLIKARDSGTVNFLADIVNEIVRPDNTLPVERRSRRSN